MSPETSERHLSTHHEPHPEADDRFQQINPVKVAFLETQGPKRSRELDLRARWPGTDFTHRPKDANWSTCQPNIVATESSLVFGP